MGVAAAAAISAVGAGYAANKSAKGAKDAAQIQASSQNPEWLNKASQDLYNRSLGIADKPYTPYTGKTLAPQDPNQDIASTLAYNSVGRFTGEYSNISDMLNNSASPYGQTYDPSKVTARDVRVNPIMGTQVGTRANPQSINTQDFTSANITGYMSPYLKAAMQPQIDDINESRAHDVNSMNARAGGSGNFGGSRAALGQDLLERRYDKQVNDVRNKGYDTAFNTGMQAFQSDQGRNLQGQMAQADIYGNDISNELKAGMSNQSTSLDAAKANTDAYLKSALANQNKDMELGKFNEGQASDAFKTNYNIFAGDRDASQNAAGQLQNLISLKSNIGNNTIANLSKTGAVNQTSQQQLYDDLYSKFQEEQDHPRAMTEYLTGILSKNPAAGRVSTTAAPQNSTAQNIGTGLQMASMFKDMYSSYNNNSSGSSTIPWTNPDNGNTSYFGSSGSTPWTNPDTGTTSYFG